MRICLIEDDVRLRRELAGWLEFWTAAQVCEPPDPADPLRWLAMQRADLIVCSMTGRFGQAPQLIGDLRALGDRAAVIILADRRDLHLIVAAVRAGAGNYCPKPINPELFHEKIQQTLGICRLSAAA